MTLNIDQHFVVEITRPYFGTDPIAPNLASAIQSWEREFNEEVEDEDEKHGFLVPEDGADEEDEDEDEESAEDEEDEEGDEEEPTSDSTLYVTATLNKEVLREIRELQSINADNLGEMLVKIAFVYGNDQVGTVRREFDVDPDVFMNFGSGAKDASDLVVGLTFDVYDSALVF